MASTGSASISFREVEVNKIVGVDVGRAAKEEYLSENVRDRGCRLSTQIRYKKDEKEYCAFRMQPKIALALDSHYVLSALYHRRDKYPKNNTKTSGGDLDKLDIDFCELSGVNQYSFGKAMEVLDEGRRTGRDVDMEPAVAVDVLKVYSYLGIQRGIDYCDKALAKYLQGRTDLTTGPQIKLPDDLLATVMSVLHHEHLPTCEEPAKTIIRFILEGWATYGPSMEQLDRMANTIAMLAPRKLLCMGFRYQGENIIEPDDTARLMACIRGKRQLWEEYTSFSIRGTRTGYDGKLACVSSRRGMEFISYRKDSNSTEDGFRTATAVRHLCITRCPVNHEWIVVGRVNRVQPRRIARENIRQKGIDKELFRAPHSAMDGLPPYTGWISTRPNEVGKHWNVRVCRFSRKYIEYSASCRKRRSDSNIVDDMNVYRFGSIWDPYHEWEGDSSEDDEGGADENWVAERLSVYNRRDDMNTYRTGCLRDPIERWDGDSSEDDEGGVDESGMAESHSE